MLKLYFRKENKNDICIDYFKDNRKIMNSNSWQTSGHTLGYRAMNDT